MGKGSVPTGTVEAEAAPSAELRGPTLENEQKGLPEDEEDDDDDELEADELSMLWQLCRRDRNGLEVIVDIFETESEARAEQSRKARDNSNLALGWTFFVKPLNPNRNTGRATAPPNKVTPPARQSIAAHSVAGHSSHTPSTNAGEEGKRQPQHTRRKAAGSRTVGTNQAATPVLREMSQSGSERARELTKSKVGTLFEACATWVGSRNRDTLASARVIERKWRKCQDGMEQLRRSPQALELESLLFAYDSAKDRLQKEISAAAKIEEQKKAQERAQRLTYLKAMMHDAQRLPQLMDKAAKAQQEALAPE